MEPRFIPTNQLPAGTRVAGLNHTVIARFGIDSNVRTNQTDIIEKQRLEFPPSLDEQNLTEAALDFDIHGSCFIASVNHGTTLDHSGVIELKRFRQYLLSLRKGQKVCEVNVHGDKFDGAYDGSQGTMFVLEIIEILEHDDPDQFYLVPLPYHWHYIAWVFEEYVNDDKNCLSIVSVSSPHSNDSELGIVQVCPQYVSTMRVCHTILDMFLEQKPTGEEDPELLIDKAIQVISKNHQSERLNMWILAMLHDQGKNLTVEEAGKYIQHSSILYRYGYIKDPGSKRPPLNTADQSQ